MRVGIMGGTLDPVHNGHLAVADAVREGCGLDSVMLLPAGAPPHKRRETDKYDRLEMARLAAQSRPGWFVSDAEVLREGTTYTVDTLHALREQFPETEWIYIVGADTADVLHLWRNFAEIAKLCSFVVASRPGTADEALRQHVEELKSRYGADIRILDVQGPDISSTQIRERVAEGRDISDCVPPEVEAYIRRKGLYLCRYSWAEIEQILAARLKPGRFAHTLGVAETAVRLAAKYGVDPQRARLAGLLHDCAKSMSHEDLIAAAKQASDVDEAELEMEPVLHAPAGMVVAEREFGVKDPQVLSAIRHHTLGRPGMQPLEALIFVADFIEPGRKPFEGLEEVRQLAETNLWDAVRRSAELSDQFVISRGGTIHPRTARMLRDDFEKTIVNEF